MKKSNLIKLFSILLIGVMVLSFCTNVLAADDSFTDITNQLNRTNTANTNTGNNAIGNTNTNNSSTNTANTNRTNTTSLYNNTNNLPQTGIEDSIPTVLLIVVFGISAVYAYKKISDYRNI